jgi:Xaa-Pro dipeptidase
VLSVTGYVWRESVGGVFGREAVLVTPDGPEVLTSSPAWSHAGLGIGRRSSHV